MTAATWRYRFAWIALVISLIGWPISAFVWAKDEPQFVLGLSWVAITLTMLDIVATAKVQVKQEDDET